MATQVQFRGGTTVEHSTFTGAAREITIDTDKDTVVVHDGATAGGYPLAKEDGATFINVDINSGTIDGTTIGATTPSTVSATDLTATGTTTLAGANTSADITFGDNVKATFGIGNDLQIYHNGGNSIIADVGTGDLYVAGDNLRLTNAALSEVYARGYANGKFSLYYDNAEKLATTSTGIDVTGTVTADGLNVENTSGYGSLEVGGSSGGLVDFKAPFSDDFDSRIISNGTDFTLDNQNAGSIIFNNNLSERMRIDSSGNVGIGTSSPNNKLTLEGSVTLNPYYATYLANSYYDSSWKYAGNGVAWGIGNNFGGVTNGTTIAVASSNSSGSGAALTWNPAFNIDSSGNVGIGTSSIASGGAGTTNLNVHTPSATSTYLKLSNTGTGNTASDGFDLSVDSSGNAYLVNRENGFLGLYTNATERMRIDSSGNVGIGTSSPSAKTEIAGSSNSTYLIAGGDDGSNGRALTFTSSASAAFNGAVHTINAPSSQGVIALSTYSTERMRIDSSGRVGIGTSSPTEILHIATASGASVINLQRTDTNTAGSVGTVSFTALDNHAVAAVAAIGDGNDEGAHLTFRTTSAASNTNWFSSTTERMRITSSGNVGIGTTSPDGRVDIAQDQNTTKFTTPHLALTATDTTDTTGFTGISYAASTLTNYGWTVGALRSTSGANSAFLFTQHNNSASGTERMRLDGSGNLQVGFSSYSSLGSSNTGCRLSADGTTNALARGSNGTVLQFYSGSGGAGYISVSGNAASYNTSSDYRLKENVETLSGAITRVKALKPKRFSWIEDGLDSPNIDGFLAHEAQTVVPEAISGAKDAMRDEEYEVTPAVLDDDGNVVTEAVMGTRSVPDYQGIDQSKLVPLLTAALQEAIAKIEDLETRVAALESA